MPFNQSHDITRHILNSALDAIICIDAKGRISFWSKQAEAMFGWNEGEVIGKQLGETIIPDRYRKSHEEGMHRFIQTGKAIMLNRLMEMQAVDHNGKEFPVELTIVPVKQGEEEFFCGFIRDITERKNAETEIRKEKEMSDYVFESLPGIFYVQDESGKYLRWNKNFENATGYSAEEIEKMHPLDFFHVGDKQRVDEAIRQCFRVGKAELIADAFTKNKNIIPFYFRAKSILYDGKKCLIGTGIDLTKQQNAQQEVKKSEEKYEATEKVLIRLKC